MDTNAILIILGIASIYLMTRKWFWIAAFGIGALASAFATLASIVHFQILGALGFFFLAAICGFVASLILSSYE